MQDLPFLAFSRAMKTAGAGTLRPEQEGAPEGAPPAPAAFSGEVGSLFEAAVSGVQTSFKHLSRDDIAHPPHRWFDAALARQIAIHITVRRHQVALRRIARELDRNKGSVLIALQKVDQRLRGAEFASAYEDMAAHAERVLRDRGKYGGEA